jgi:hypothetical protein
MTYVLKDPSLSYGTKYAVLENAAWTWTEFNGKYHGCAYWTERAYAERPLVSKKEVSKHFRHEHAVPKGAVAKMLLDLKSPTEEQVKKICDEFLVAVVVTLSENTDLNRSYGRTMPPEFFDPNSDKFHDKFLRYKVNEITVIPCTVTEVDETPVIRKTPVGDRLYRAVLSPNGEVIVRSFKGKQRQVTYDSLIKFPKGATAKMLSTDIGDKLVAKAGVEASVAWHLRHLGSMRIAEVLDPIIKA